MNPVAGIDEVGRGPLAGPVVAAAVVLGHDHGIEGLNDSKKLSETMRERLAAEIHRHALGVGIGLCDVAEIESLNILGATLLAMRKAFAELPIPVDQVLIDGNRDPCIPGVDARLIVGGDASVPEISAASIVAKVHRDRLMRRLHQRHPEYGFDRHKGYGTRFHLEALQRFGPCPEHRASFLPVRQARLFQ